MTWTRFMDMHSGGGAKTEYDVYYVEAKEDIAVALFEVLTGQDPHEVACSCCGENYAWWEVEKLPDHFDKKSKIFRKNDLEALLK